jgi:hypothetical protein
MFLCCVALSAPETKTKRGFWQQGRYKTRGMREKGTRLDPGPMVLERERERERKLYRAILDASARPLSRDSFPLKLDGSLGQLFCFFPATP